MKKLLTFTLFTLTLFVSCEKKIDTVTDIKIIEDQLKELVREKEIKKCSIIIMSGEKRHKEHDDVDFTISNGFVVVNGYVLGKKYQDSYNLLYLSRYLLHTDNTLGLYFANTN